MAFERFLGPSGMPQAVGQAEVRQCIVGIQRNGTPKQADGPFLITAEQGDPALGEVGERVGLVQIDRGLSRGNAGPVPLPC